MPERTRGPGPRGPDTAPGRAGPGGPARGQRTAAGTGTGAHHGIGTAGYASRDAAARRRPHRVTVTPRGAAPASRQRGAARGGRDRLPRTGRDDGRGPARTPSPPCGRRAWGPSSGALANSGLRVHQAIGTGGYASPDAARRRPPRRWARPGASVPADSRQQTAHGTQPSRRLRRTGQGDGRSPGQRAHARSDAAPAQRQAAGGPRSGAPTDSGPTARTCRMTGQASQDARGADRPVRR